MIAPTPPREAERLEALRSFGVLDTLPEAEYDDLTRLAAAICGTPIAFVSLVDSCRQWFKSCIGLDCPETPREISFCSHTILQNEALVVPDATQDIRFQDNPLVTGDPHLRFYAGMPLAAPEGHNLGTLCVADQKVRNLTSTQMDALRVLARQVMAQLVLRRELRHSKAIETALRESEGRFRGYMDNNPAIAYMKDDAGRMAYVNETLRRTFGVEGDAWIGKTDYDLFPAEFADLYRKHDLQVLAGSVAVQYAESTPGPGGSVKHWRSYKFPFTDAAGRRFLAGMSVDVSAETKAENALRESEAKFRSVVDGLAEGVILIDLDTKSIVQSNATFRKLVGYSLKEIDAMKVYDFLVQDRQILDDEFKQFVEQGPFKLGRRQMRRKDGGQVFVEASVSTVDTSDRRLAAMVLRDMAEQLAYEAQLLAYQAELEDANVQLQALAATDGLTGVRNRAALNDRLQEEFDRATRFGRPLSMIILDVDNFKLFNDTFGHPAGDEVLRTVARTLDRTARKIDFVARYGGEEFVVLLPDTDVSGAMVLAERFRLAIAAVEWEKRAVTVSVGVSTMMETTRDAACLLQEADSALYRSKQTGRNRVCHGSGLVPMLAKK